MSCGQEPERASAAMRLPAPCSHQREEAAEHVGAEGLVELWESGRSRAERGCAEG